MATAAADAVPLSGDSFIDGLVEGGKWQFAGSPVLTYSLNLSGFETTTWSPAASNAVAQAFAAWAAVANLNFSSISSPPEVADSPADLAVTLTGHLLQSQLGAVAVGVFPDADAGNSILTFLSSFLGVTVTRADYPGPEGDIFFDETYQAFSFLNPGGAGFAIGLHEIGHALGLKHPHDDGGNDRPTFSELGIPQYDDGLWTVMSDNEPNPGSFSSGRQATPMPLDILAIQHIYGANMSYHTGNDAYALADDRIVRTIWDAGGTDTVSAAGLGFGVTLDLRPGTITHHGATSVTAIAFNVMIENAVGTVFNDVLTGNDADNILNGGTGADSMSGGLGNDTYMVDNAGDTAVELFDGGVDLVQSSVTFSLGFAVDNLTLTGSGAINGTGNGLNNVITGNNNNNVLVGGAGFDTLIGGAGDDTYIENDTDDTIIEAPGGGVDLVQSTFNFTLGPEIENLALSGSGPLNGTGNNLANFLLGNTDPNVLTGLGGNDTLDGRQGADTMVGGPGNDIYFVDATGDAVNESAGEGTDTVESSVNGYVLPAEVENLTLLASAATGTGNALANVLTGNVLANTLTGGDGDDTYVIGAGDTVIEDPDGGFDTVQSLATYTLGANVEELMLVGRGALNGAGNADDNVLIGNHWNNVLTGNAGDDTLKGQGGKDTMVGGPGDDTYIVDGGGDVVTEAPNEGLDTVFSSIGFVLGANVENLALTGFRDSRGTGNPGANTLTGNDGDNVLDGKGGNDLLSGGGGDDILGFDSLDSAVSGGAGVDTLSFFGPLSQTLDLTATPNAYSGIEKINLTGGRGANNTLTLTVQDVLDLSDDDRLIVNGNAGDTVVAGSPGPETWTVQGHQVIGRIGYTSYAGDNGSGDIASLLVQDHVAVVLA